MQNYVSTVGNLNSYILTKQINLQLFWSKFVKIFHKLLNIKNFYKFLKDSTTVDRNNLKSI